ncbi:MAG TPA: hypothetical protein VIH59_33060, partial [Candidatus Tectomicrobia bacterium]
MHNLEHYPDLVQRLGVESLAVVQSTLLKLHAAAPATAEAFLRLASGTLGLLPAVERLQTLTWCQQIAAVSPAGVVDFLHRLPDLTHRLPGQRLQSWVTAGIEVARRHTEAGQAYFALESATAQNRLQALQKLVAFTDVERVLHLYTEALLGRRVPLQTTVALPEPLRAGGRELPTTDGTAIFVPEQVDEFAEARQNFSVYKVAILHQVGFYECGTFTFALEELQRRVPESAWRLAAPGESPQTESLTAFDRFFACFPQAELARQLFAILEDARIDAYLRRHYKGIRRELALVMQHSLQQRPLLQDMPLRQALLEGLLQVTLGGSLPVCPAALHLLLQLLARRLQPLLEAQATVYDTVTAVLDCYRLVTEVPGRAAAAFSTTATAQLEALLAQLPDAAETISLAALFRQAGENADTMPALPESTVPAQGVAPVPYRGELKPELIQKQLRLQELSAQLQALQEPLSPLPPEILKALLERGNIEIKSLQDGNLSATSGLFVNDLEGRAGARDNNGTRRAALQQEIDGLRAELHEAYGALEAPPQAMLYDEWDYQIKDYRRRWCRLTETVLHEDGTAFVEETRRKYAELLTLVSRQFQL